MSRIDKTLKDLLDTSRDLPVSSSNLGTLQLNLNELQRRAQHLKKKHSPTQNLKKAHYLLAGSGLVIGDVDASFKGLQERQLLDTSLRVSTDNAKHSSKRVQKENVLSSIEDIIATSTRTFDNSVNTSLNLNWSQHEQNILQNFQALLKKQNLSDDTVSEQSTNTFSGNGHDPDMFRNNDSNVNESFLNREKFEKYASIIFEYNNARQSRVDYPLLEKFQSMSSTNRSFIFSESWQILRSIQDPKNVAKSSISYLENQFLKFTNQYHKNSANTPMVEKIKTFISLKLKGPKNTWKFENLVLVGEIPIWALIFYLLRAGLEEDALNVTIMNKNNFKKVEQTFVTYFKAYLSSEDGTLPTEFSTRLVNEYNQHIKSSMNGDPYRLAVYLIIGKRYLSKKIIPKVTLNIEDWLWLHLKLVTSSPTPNFENDQYSLSNLQSLIISHGPERFGNNYLQVLLLSGLYESAVKYSYAIDKYDSIHLAIALSHLRFLDFTKSREVSLFQTSPNEFIDFGELVINYIYSFMMSDTRFALEYVCLLSLINNKDYAEVCHSTIKKLLLTTKDFKTLLGRIDSSGNVLPGAISERKNLLFIKEGDTFLQDVMNQAISCMDESNNNDLFLLYQIKEEYNKALSVASTMLADFLSDCDADYDLLFDINYELNPAARLNKIFAFYVGHPEIKSKLLPENISVASKLLSLADAKRFYKNGKWQECLDSIRTINILPFGEDQNVREKAREFTLINPNLFKNISNILLLAMRCVSNILHELEQNTFHDESGISYYQNLRKRIIIYAGLLQSSLPNDTYLQLVGFDTS